MSSLVDVWGENENTVHSVSAKFSSNDQPKIVEPHQDLRNSHTLQSDELSQLLKALLLETHELRREQARRCSVYMIMIGILFGIMILYVDKLNSNLNNKYRISSPYA